MNTNKILFVASDAQYGGATKELLYIATNLKKNFKPIVLMNKIGPLTDMCKANNIEYIILCYKPFAMSKGSSKLKKIIKKFLYPFFKIQYILCNKLALEKIDKLINMKDISIIHTNVNRDDFGALLAKRYNIPHVWHLREFGDLDYDCIYFKKNYIDFMNQNADYFIAISNVIKDNFIKKWINKLPFKI